VRSGSDEDGTYSLEEEFRMKKILVALIAALVLAPQTQAAGKKFRIAVSLPPANNAWQAKMLDSVNEEVAKDTTNFEITVKNAVDDADQLNMMQTFKAGGYDLIAILPGNGTLMTPIVQDINKSGTKVMVIDRPIEGDQFTVFYGGDNAQCGKNAAKYIGDRLKGKGQVAVLRSYVGIPIDQQRYGGFMEVLKASYPGIKVLVEGDGEFNQQAGLKAVSNILPAYPQIDAIFSQDDESAVGALTAIKSANRKDIQFVTGMGGSKSAYARMSAKDPLYGASMSYLPTMGGHALALAKKILKGEKFNKMNIEPTVVVTADNVSKYLADAY
jgi:ribose transport system substrate-binding protein